MKLLEPALTAAISDALDLPSADIDPLIRNSEFSDYQSNVALGLAKSLGIPPREVARRVVEQLAMTSGIESVEISGPGFINIRISDLWIADQLKSMASDRRLGVSAASRPIVIPIDYSAPNVAKEMHVGHLRTTIIGDCLARVLDFLGHSVVRQNHIGDWGTPFGMLIEHLLELEATGGDVALVELDPNAFYQAARARFDEDNEFADRARRRVVLLQSGHAKTIEHWRALVAMSKAYFNNVYSILDITLGDTDLAGESTYNAQLKGVCDELEARGIAVESEGALCVFLEGRTGRDGRPLPLIIRKSDGGYSYATTDLATVRHRIHELNGKRIVYVIGVTQSLHLEMVWETARLAGWVPPEVELVHVKVGSVLGRDKKLLRTRSGTPMRLMALVEEALARAKVVVEQARPDLSLETRDQISPKVAIGAVKYADLSVAHDTDYVFDAARMTMFTGNTGPYLQYAAARTRSILRKSGSWDGARTFAFDLEAERNLALKLVEFADVVDNVGASLAPHLLCTYLHDVARSFSVFYEECPVLGAGTPTLRESRLALTFVTGRVLELGLGLLGISVPSQM
ncbi:MAG TPA: arginine--tRNA ligase [Bryobacteraceae bacterium]